MRMTSTFLVAACLLVGCGSSTPEDTSETARSPLSSDTSSDCNEKAQAYKQCLRVNPEGCEAERAALAECAQSDTSTPGTPAPCDPKVDAKCPAPAPTPPPACDPKTDPNCEKPAPCDPGDANCSVVVGDPCRQERIVYETCRAKEGGTKCDALLDTLVACTTKTKP